MISMAASASTLSKVLVVEKGDKEPVASLAAKRYSLLLLLLLLLLLRTHEKKPSTLLSRIATSKRRARW